MRIVTTHLTRMSSGYICVAGVEIESGYHVRPVVFGRLSAGQSAAKGGPFDIGEVVDLGSVGHVGIPPEIEDFRFGDGATSALGTLSSEVLWDVLSRLSSERLSELFGPDIEPNGRTFAVREGLGQASLGVLRSAQPISLEIDAHGSLRCAIWIDDLRSSLPVTDLRFFTDDTGEYQLDHSAVERTQSRLRSGVPTLLNVGLTRPWQKSGDDVARHWLQVNNLHLRDDPLWRVSGRASMPYSGSVPFLDAERGMQPAVLGTGGGGSGYHTWIQNFEGSSPVGRRAASSEPPLAVEIWSRLRRLFRG